MKRNIKHATNILWFLLTIVIISICFYSKMGLAEEGKNISDEEIKERVAKYFVEPDMLKLPGNYFRAVMVAYKAFQKRLEKFG